MAGRGVNRWRSGRHVSPFFASCLRGRCWACGRCYWPGGTPAQTGDVTIALLVVPSPDRLFLPLRDRRKLVRIKGFANRNDRVGTPVDTTGQPTGTRPRQAPKPGGIALIYPLGDFHPLKFDAPCKGLRGWAHASPRLWLLPTPGGPKSGASENDAPLCSAVQAEPSGIEALRLARLFAVRAATELRALSCRSSAAGRGILGRRYLATRRAPNRGGAVCRYPLAVFHLEKRLGTRLTLSGQIRPRDTARSMPPLPGSPNPSLPTGPGWDQVAEPRTGRGAGAGSLPRA
jgi:hypothetical protein